MRKRKMADSVSVFGGRAPAEVEQLSKHLKTLDRDTFSQMLSGQSDNNTLFIILILYTRHFHTSCLRHVYKRFVLLS